MIFAECREALADKVRPAVEALGATLYRWPVGDNPATTRVTLVSRPRGRGVDIPTFELSQPKRARCVWELDVVCRSDASLQPVEDAEALVQDLASAALQAVHDDLGLGGISKTVGAVGRWLLLEARVIDLDPPEVYDDEHGSAVAVSTITVQFTAQIFH